MDKKHIILRTFAEKVIAHLWLLTVPGVGISFYLPHSQTFSRKFLGIFHVYYYLCSAVLVRPSPRLFDAGDDPGGCFCNREKLNPLNKEVNMDLFDSKRQERLEAARKASVASKEAARAFLIRAGILLPNGEVAPHLR